MPRVVLPLRRMCFGLSVNSRLLPCEPMACDDDDDNDHADNGADDDDDDTDEVSFTYLN